MVGMGLSTFVIIISPLTEKLARTPTIDFTVKKETLLSFLLRNRNFHKNIKIFVSKTSKYNYIDISLYLEEKMFFVVKEK